MAVRPEECLEIKKIVEQLYKEIEQVEDHVNFDMNNCDTNGNCEYK